MRMQNINDADYIKRSSRLIELTLEALDFKVKEELVNAGVLREWNDKDYQKTPKGSKPKGNIVWKNVKKYKILKEIQIKETARVNEERKKEIFPKTIGDLNK